MCSRRRWRFCVACGCIYICRHCHHCCCIGFLLNIGLLYTAHACSMLFGRGSWSHNACARPVLSTHAHSLIPTHKWVIANNRQPTSEQNNKQKPEKKYYCTTTRLQLKRRCISRARAHRINCQMAYSDVIVTVLLLCNLNAFRGFGATLRRVCPTMWRWRAESMHASSTFTTTQATTTIVTTDKQNKVAV